MSPRVRGVVVATYSGILMALLFLIQLPVMLLTLSGGFSIWLARHVWSPSNLWLAGVRVAVHGSTLPEGPAIFVSNHESALDIWALFRSLPGNVRFLAKRELFRIPVFGWYLALAGFVAVDRRNYARAIASVRKAAGLVRRGTSLIVFAEGTRSRDGRIHSFKKGPFALAIEAGVPIVPVAIAGAAALNPRRRLEVSPGTVHVVIGAPIDPRTFPDRMALLREVRSHVIAQHVAYGGLGGDDDPIQVGAAKRVDEAPTLSRTAIRG